MASPEQHISGKLVGYSALELFEECYEYNENACYVADSPESLRNFIINAGFSIKDYRIDPVKFSDFLKDFGCSCGEYALEPKALERFEEAAKAYGIKYTVDQYDDSPFKIESNLFVVNFEGWQHAEEEFGDEKDFGDET